MTGEQIKNLHEISLNSDINTAIKDQVSQLEFVLFLPQVAIQSVQQVSPILMKTRWNVSLSVPTVTMTKEIITNQEQQSLQNRTVNHGNVSLTKCAQDVNFKWWHWCKKESC